MRQFCTFYLGSELFGIEVLKVQEVMLHQMTTAVPLAPKVVRGLMNLRGSIVSCIDLRLRFEMPPAPPEVEPIHVVTRTDGGLVSFEVDRIGEVVEITDSSFESSPSTLKGEAKKLIEGVYKLKDSLLLVVNLAKVLELEGNY
jgi:purine-binding chemotaxis protein CheW